MVISMQAQNRYNLIFFAENGEKFVVILNGVVQNKTPATNVQVTDLKASGYKVRIDFEQEELGFFDDWSDRYGYVIDLGKNLEPLSEEFKTDEYLVPGCQSRLWLHTELQQDQMHITADSDSLIVKGLVAIMIRVYSGQSPDQILNTPPQFLSDLGFESNLSPSRANGLNSMIQKIQMLAKQYQHMLKSQA